VAQATELPLAGYRVIDLSTMFTGPYCTRMLADYGADVIKIEPPSGDPVRSEGPFYHDEPHPEKSGMFLFLNTNKRSITLDIESHKGQVLLKELVKDAAIVIENFKPGYLDDLGLGYGDLSKINPTLVMTSITNFGQTGPYKHWEGVDLTMWAMGGAMNTSGHGEREPLKMSGRIASHHVGSVASLATLTALWKAELQEEGDHVDISFFETWMGAIERHTSQLLSYQFTGETAPRPIPGSRLGTGARPVLDGHFHITSAGGTRFARLLKMMEMEELLNEPPYNDEFTQAQPETSEIFDTVYIPWMLEHTKDELTDLVIKNGVLGGGVNTVQDLLENKQFRHRNYWQTIDHPMTGPLEYPGYNFRTHGAPLPEKRQRAPLLGEHNKDILGEELGLTGEDLVLLRERGTI
jgi:crotonobetainyl-CoA:carnitine CoA-transferase CaiB-like acyl-CoA transferase